NVCLLRKPIEWKKIRWTLHFLAILFKILSLNVNLNEEGPLEITWKHLTATDRIPPAPLIKERFCAKLEKDDHVAALTCITNNPPKDLQPFSKSSWLNLFQENSQRFQKDTLVRLMNGASNIVSNSSMPNPILVYLMQSCKEFFLAPDFNAAHMDSVKNTLPVTRVKDDSKMAGELVKQVGHVASDAEGKENCYIGAFIDSMAENTRMKELQNEVKHNAEDLRRLSITVEKLEAALAAQSKSQDKKMDQIQLTL
ncbi:hypothetical protein SESBI_18362, partial [Sesbania bispinosa]